MKIYEVTEEHFRKYGRIVSDIDFAELIERMQPMEIPRNVVYEPSVGELETLTVAGKLKDRFYGELPIQIGYCNGHNTLLNAVEYHRSSEINVAVTDMILLLGLQMDVSDEYTYETNRMEAFLVPAGTAVELYATTLHYAPCQVDEQGFKAVVVLPKGTNYPLEREHAGGEDSILTAKNKWLIGHAEGNLPEGTHIGLIGNNINIG